MSSEREHTTSHDRATYFSPHGHKSDPDPQTQPSGLRIGRVADVEIFAHWSVLVIFTLILFSLGASVFPNWHPEWPPLLTWAIALAASLCFFASILTHELSHAVVAHTQDIPIHRITLFLFGGLAHMESEPKSPKAEFLVAIAGPLASIAIGVLSITLGVWLAELGGALDAVQDPEAMFRAIGPIPTLLLWLGPINLALAVFNLVPGFPLDGGRVLRAALWAATGDPVKASRWAAKAGQAVAWGLILLGVMSALRGAFLQGLWMVLIGSFLNNAARSSYQHVLMEKAMGLLTVERAMRQRVEWVQAQTTVDELVSKHLFESDQRAFPVVSHDRLIGVVSFSDVRQVPHSRWHKTSVSEIMTPLKMLVTLPKHASAAKALELLAAHNINQIVVVEKERVVGLVQHSDLLTWIALQGRP